MGNYIDSSKLEERITSSRFDSLCRVTGDDQTSLVEAVIGRSEAVVDGYAAPRYSLPLPVNDLVEEWALCIAEYELYKRGPGGNVPDKIRKSYEDTLVLLADLSSGKISIPSATAVPSNSNGSSISVKSSTALFDETSMEGF